MPDDDERERDSCREISFHLLHLLPLLFFCATGSSVWYSCLAWSQFLANRTEPNREANKEKKQQANAFAVEKKEREEHLMLMHLTPLIFFLSPSLSFDGHDVRALKIHLRIFKEDYERTDSCFCSSSHSTAACFWGSCRLLLLFRDRKIQSKPDGFSFKKNEKRSKTAEGVESEYNSTKSTACRRRLTSFCQRKHNHTFLEMKLVMTPEAHDASLTMILS